MIYLLPLPSHTHPASTFSESSSSKITLNKTLFSTYIFSQYLSGTVLRETFSPGIFTLKFRTQESRGRYSHNLIYNFSVVLWHENSEIQAGEPLFPSLCNLHGPVCWLIVIQWKLVPTNFWRSWGERQDCFLYSWQAKAALPKCSFLTL